MHRDDIGATSKHTRQTKRLEALLEYAVLRGLPAFHLHCSVCANANSRCDSGSEAGGGGAMMLD